MAEIAWSPRDRLSHGADYYIAFVANEMPSLSFHSATMYGVEDRALSKYLLHITTIKQERPALTMRGTFQGSSSVIRQIPGISSILIEGKMVPVEFTRTEKFICDIRGINLRGRIESTE